MNIRFLAFGLGLFSKKSAPARKGIFAIKDLQRALP